MATSMQRSAAIGCAAAFCLTFAGVAEAHPLPLHFQNAAAALSAGAAHPLTGWDHLLAMLASGLLAVRVGTRRALWVVPLSFISLMLFGGLLAYLGVPMPHAEWAISGSVIVLGLAVAALPKPPLALGAALVGAFAFFHGHAHVAELQGHALLPYMAGFTFSTLVLHVTAIIAALAVLRSERQTAVRFAGGAIAAIFCVLLLVGV